MELTILMRYQPIHRPGRYLGFTHISTSVKTADIIGLNMSWKKGVIFLTHPDNLYKEAQRSKSRQLSYNNASRLGLPHGLYFTGLAGILLLI